MKTEDMANNIFKNLKNLAGSSIKVERDLSEERQIDRKVMMKVKSVILEADKTHKIFVKNDSIKIGVNWMRWNKNRELVCGEKKAEEVLKDMYGEKLNFIDLTYDKLLENINQKN